MDSNENSPPSWALPALLAATLASRLVFLSESPVDMPAVLLARGVAEYDPVHAQPHLPGYPGVILLARGVGLLGADALDALRWVSALGSTALVAGGWAVARRVGAPPLLVAGLLAANPAAWYFGETANTYAVGAAAATWTAWAALRSRTEPSASAALWVGLLLGVTGTLRPSLLLLLAPMVALATGRRVPLAAAAAAIVTLAQVSWSADASGGLGPYVAAIGEAAARAAPEGETAVQHAHRLALYIVQTLSAGILLLPWWRRGFLRLPPRVRPVLALWVGVPFAVHALFHAELGYLLAYAAAPMLIGAAAPKAMVAAATVMSAALFLLPAPLDAARDSRPSGLGVDTPGDAAAVEASFLVAPSRRGLADTASANHTFTRLLAPRAGPGTTIVCDRRWNETVAEQLLPGVRATWRDAPKLLVPAEGARLLFVGWDDPGPGWRRLEQDGLVAWSRDIAPSDVPFTFRGLQAVRVD